MPSSKNSKKAKDSKRVKSPKQAKAGPPWPKRSLQEYELLICTFLDQLLADAVRPDSEPESLIKKH